MTDGFERFKELLASGIVRLNITEEMRGIN